MATYRLSDLIIFWHNISERKFNAIQEVLDVIDDDDIPDDTKKDLILESLRFHGLYEIGYEPTGKEQEIEDIEETDLDPVFIPVQVFDTELLNINLRVVVILN